jgi:site-specific DNA-methyltransferase (adenine-specific)
MLLLHGDCLEVMKTLPDKSVDLFLCDLPYGCLTNQPLADGTPGMSKGGKHYTSKGFARPSHEGTTLVGKLKNIGGCAWDIKLDLPQFWDQVKRLCKDDHTPVLMFCSTKFGFDLYNSNPDWFRYDLIWEKTRAVGFLCANKMPMRSHELIYVFAKKGATYYRKDMEGEFKSAAGGRNFKPDSQGVYGTIASPPPPDNEGKRCVKSVVTIANKMGKGQHPTQKPDDLYEWLITRYSKPGDTVLDPTAGSFASVFTAERLGRIGIGVEKDEAFYKKAHERSLTL